ncbi:ABC transporter ATP-binding protein [Rhodopseudomonas palustris]|uniref:ABC transporter ATP-binding protein n=1 Tax=Rhodopseudomonas palustris TaxID=1076 RepID=UPI000E5C0786|nr:ABC transporter ATP-binding protein [Rhodopseudomonas palustris]QLH70504.1 ABC transporter ATP-binding protein [Rhodopseudomonas palustris]RIA03848.1 ABC transporter ATP-binding protein [Rhodopseudomonas palustris]
MVGLPALSVEGLTVKFADRGGDLTAVSGLDFELAQGETLALVGESGCGKSLTALALLGLIAPPGRVEGHAIRLDGRDILGLRGEQMRRLRGNRIAMIFQEPMTALNPVLSIGEQIVEAIREHENISYSAARERAVALLDRVRIPDPRRRFDDYPHRLSGGMRQRVVIAIALACSPSVLVADEPTTALDVTIQAQILELIDELKRETGTAVLLITHDLGVVAEHADRVLVMYAGRKVEERATRDLLRTPRHPYTSGLIAAHPRLGAGSGFRARLTEIGGMVPSLREMPLGCRFAPRCLLAIEACHVAPPPLIPVREGGSVACLRIEESRVSELASFGAGAS